MENHVAELDVVSNHLQQTKNVLLQTENALQLSICSFNPMFQTTSKHLEANFKSLLGLEVVADVVFLVLSSESNN